MKIQINTPHPIQDREKIIEEAESAVQTSLGHLSEHLTRVEVHLSDQNSEKGGSADKRCMMEARVERHQPVAVTHESATFDQAIEGAADKLKHALNHLMDRLKKH